MSARLSSALVCQQRVPSRARRGYTALKIEKPPPRGGKPWRWREAVVVGWVLVTVTVINGGEEPRFASTEPKRR
jgi:hypothetical protein